MSKQKHAFAGIAKLNFLFARASAEQQDTNKHAFIARAPPRNFIV